MLHSSGSQIISELRTLAHQAAGNTYAPYSGTAEGAALLLSDGEWIPGVRVENASFSLTIPALVNVYTTMVAAGRRDIAAIVVTKKVIPSDVSLLDERQVGGPPVATDDTILFKKPGSLPEIRQQFTPYATGIPNDDHNAFCGEARRISSRAWVPESGFPVGCLLVASDGPVIPGCNVEHPDWTRILCAERNAVGTAVSYGYFSFRKLYISAPLDVAAAPCGSCRQVLTEFTPGMQIVLDRGEEPPEITTSQALLPCSFKSDVLKRFPSAT